MRNISRLALSFLFASILINLGCQKDNRFNSHDLQETIDFSPLNLSNFILDGDPVTMQDSFAESIVGIINMEKGSLCTGTLLNRNHLLTAAHCLGHQITSMRVFSGLSRKDSTNILDAESMITPPQWETRSKEEFDRGDLAIIKFSSGLPKSYKPVVLGNTADLQNGKEVLIAGYGRTDGVNKKGAGVLRKTFATIAETHYGETEVLFDQQNGKGACHGDSGGPAFLSTSKGLIQWGVTSREHLDPDKDCTHFSVYTKIEPYLDWINENSLN